MGLLGDDGDGYELAVRLDNSGTMEEWLGSIYHHMLTPHLSSRSAWHSFMNSSSRAALTLQMRVRALLFDKAAGYLSGDDSKTFETISASSLTAYDLQLDPNGVYFPLEKDAEDWKRLQAEAVPVITNPPFKHGAGPIDRSNRNGEEGQESKRTSCSFQPKHALQVVQSFSSLMSPKQEISRPSLNKVKKVEAWDSFDAKRPSEMIGTINKKLRSPKISSKPFLQGDPSLNLSHRDHNLDKMKSPLGSFQEPKYLATGMGRSGHIDNESTGLWYDRVLDKHIGDRMQRVAHRSAQQKLPFEDRESCFRTAEGMAAYIDQFSNSHRKLSMAGLNTDSNSVVETNKSQKFFVGDAMALSELKFLDNSVPDNPVPAKQRRLNDVHFEDGGLEHAGGNRSRRAGRGNTFQSKGRSDSQMEPEMNANDLKLFPVPSKSSECLSKISESQAEHIMRQTVAKVVASAGFEGSKQTSMDILCGLLACHLQKLGAGLRVFSDSYAKHCSPTETLVMFMQNNGDSVEHLLDHMKAESQGRASVVPQIPVQVSDQKRRTATSQSPTLPPALPPLPQPSQPGMHQQAPPQLPYYVSMDADQEMLTIPSGEEGFSGKALKRRQPSNLGRTKKVEKDRSVNEGKFAGEARSDLSRTVSDMRMSGVGGRLHSQQPWHAHMPPLVQQQPGPVLHNFKQQLSSMQQFPSFHQR